MKTLLLIGVFASGSFFEQELPDDVCRRVEQALAHNIVVVAETELGKFETIATGSCHSIEEATS